jgi:hypothetical protein
MYAFNNSAQPVNDSGGSHVASSTGNPFQKTWNKRRLGLPENLWLMMACTSYISESSSASAGKICVTDLSAVKYGFKREV